MSPTTMLVVRKCLISTAGIYVTYQIMVYLKHRYHQRRLRKRAAQRRQERDDQVEKIGSQIGEIPESVREDIHTLSYAELKLALRERKFSVLAVLRAYQEKAILAHNRTNCLVGFLEDAEEKAQSLDNLKNIDDLPLFGIPFSVKESIAMKDVEFTCGLASGIGKQSKRTALMVEVLIAAGAVPFARTNVPSMLTFGCSNEIFGTTTNPHNQERSSGGSSCGEGALLAMRGSVFGLGTDLGGSIRVPAAYNGIAGIRPTSTRVSQLDMFSSQRYAYVYPSSGPMSWSTECIQDVMQVLLDADRRLSSFRDLTVPKIPWNHAEVQKEKLRIGYFETDDDGISAVPALRRGVRIAVEKLRKQGHDVVPFKIPGMDKVVHLFLSAAIMSDGKLSAEVVFNDLVMNDFSHHYWLVSKPIWFRRLYLSIFECQRQVDCYTILPKTIKDVKDLFDRLITYRRDVIGSMLKNNIDVIVCPVNASVALKMDAVEIAFQAQHAFIYSEIFNLVDLPAGVVKVSDVTQADVNEFNKSYPKSDYLDRVIAESNSGEDTVGLPIAVQIAARPHCEEVVVKLMRDLSDS